MSDLYKEVILAEFEHPQNTGVLEEADVVIDERNASCGDQVKVYIQLDSAKKKIEGIRWIGEGCAISMATMSLLSNHLRQMPKEAVLQLDKQDLEEMIGLEEPIAMGREKCLLLGLEAVKKGLSQ